MLQSLRPRLLRLCLRWTRGNHSDAEDLLSDAWLRGLEALRAHPGPVSNPVGWWATIVANLARDAKRRQGCRGALELNQDDLTDASPDAEGQLLIRERFNQTVERLNRMTRRQRAAVLYRGAGVDYAQIALCLGTTGINARKIVEQARQALRSPTKPARVRASRCGGTARISKEHQLGGLRIE